MSDDPNSLELRSVVKRFNDSGQALEQLREKLRTLADLEAENTSSTASVTAASEALTNHAAQIDLALEGLRSAIGQTEGAMTAARGLLDGSDFASIRTEVAAIGTAVGGGRDEMRAATGSISEQIRKLQEAHAATGTSVSRVLALLEQELATARVQASAANEARLALEAKVQAIPEKTRRKLGL